MIRLLAILLLVWPVFAQADLLIRNVRLFDGTRVTAATDVLIVDQKVARIGKALKAPDKTPQLDGTGLTLLPGLIDAHTHTYQLADLRQALVFGVTTELDMFTTPAFIKTAQEKQSAQLAALFSAGILITAPKGHGTQFGIKIPTLTDPKKAQAFVDARIAEGSAYIKIVYDAGRAYGIKMPTLSKETLIAVVAAAHVRKKLAVVHVGDLESAREAVAAGADGLVHVFIDKEPDAAFIQLAVSKKIFIIPTLAVYEGSWGKLSGLERDKRLQPYLTASDRAKLSRRPTISDAGKSVAIGTEAIRALHKAGVPILTGSDTPNPGTLHGASIHRELVLLVNAGLTPTEALAAATSIPARHFGLTDRGRIAVGLRADLLLVKGDPTTDITATRAIVGIWKAGVKVDRAAYRKWVVTVNAAPKKAVDGWVSRFEGKQLASLFGAGWSKSTDAMRGGTSTVKLTLVAGGANDSKGALKVSGEIKAGAGPWAGAMFSPGTRQFAPANLSSKKSVSFWAKGDGRAYQVMLFTQSGGYQPGIQQFTPSDKWRRFSFALTKFGTKGGDITGLFFGAGFPAGKFALQLDDVRFED